MEGHTFKNILDNINWFWFFVLKISYGWVGPGLGKSWGRKYDQNRLEILKEQGTNKKFFYEDEFDDIELVRILRLHSSQLSTEVEALEALHWVHVSTSFQVCINAECVDMEKTYKSTNCSLKCKGHAVSLERSYPQFDKPYAISVLLQ